MTCVSGAGWNNVAALKAINGGQCENSYVGTGQVSKMLNGTIIDGLIKQKKGGGISISCSTTVFSFSIFIIFLFY